MRILQTLFKCEKPSNSDNAYAINQWQSRRIFLITFLYWSFFGSLVPYIVAYEHSLTVRLFSSAILTTYIAIIYTLFHYQKERAAKVAFIICFLASLVYMLIVFGEFSRAHWLAVSVTAVLFSIFPLNNFVLTGAISVGYFCITILLYAFQEPFLPVNQNYWYDLYIGCVQLLYMIMMVSHHSKRIETARGIVAQRQKELERLNLELVSNKLALEKINQELHQFASCASHDMREPLRTISSFSSLVKNRLPQDDKNQELLAFVVDGAKRMTVLLDDLISYTRVTQIDANSEEWVDLNQLLSEVCKNILLKIEESGTRIESMRLPLVKAAKTHMLLLLQNLISNSIKYAHTDRKPHIVINWIKKDEGLVILIRDNGIGIDEKYLEEIFQPFKRLHPIGKYEGSGIGLATCKKIAETYQGRISATSEFGYSTTIMIDLPIPIRELQHVGGEEEPNALRSLLEFSGQAY